MKKLEKIVLLVLLAALVGRLCGLLWCRGIFVMAAWLLSLIYLAWGYHYLRRDQDTPVWLAVLAGVGLASSLFILPFLTMARRSLPLELLPTMNMAVLVLLLVRYAWRRRKKLPTSSEGLLRWRAAVLLIPVSFLAYAPPTSFPRAVIRTLNPGDDQLLSNMDMLEASEAYDEAISIGDCAAALEHAERAYQAGRIWLFGREWDHSVPDSITFREGATYDLAGTIRRLQAERERDDLPAIGGTLNQLYDAHQCLGKQAEQAGEAALAYMHYYKGDSLFNLIERTGNGAKQRVWSRQNMARSASKMGEYNLADSLYTSSLDLYEEVSDTVDAGCGWILHDWSRSLAERRYWKQANYLLRGAIGFSERDSITLDPEEQWVHHRLQLVKNLINCDSLDLGARVLERCLRRTPVDSALRCEVMLMKGSLQFRQNAFRAADSTFADALTCLGALPNADPLSQMAYMARGYTRLALAEYAQALEMVDAAEALGKEKGISPAAEPGLLQLRAAIYHQQGRYADALTAYENCMHRMRAIASDQLPVALAGTADVLLDLARPDEAGRLVEEALPQLADTMTDLVPNQTPVLNTAAYTDYHLGDLTRASERYAFTLDICMRYGATRTSNYAQALNGLGLVEMARSRAPQADTLFANAYRITTAIHGTEHPFTAQVMINQAELRVMERRFVEAERLLNAARPITLRILGNDHDQLGDIEKALGDLAARAGDVALASAHYREALRIYAHCFSSEHPKVQALRKQRTY